MLAQYQRRFKYILVDEYQDTNVAQYLWLRLIAQRACRRAHRPLPVGEVASAASRVRGRLATALPSPPARLSDAGTLSHKGRG